MVEVMKPSTSITRYEMKRVEEWYVIATVHINRFHQPDCDPRPQQYEMSCGRDDAEKESKPKYNCFHWMGKFSHHAKRCLETVMYLVNVFVQPFVVRQSMYPVMPCVLNHRTDKYLSSYNVPARHLSPFIWYSKHFSKCVCSKNHRKLNNNVTEYKEFEAPPLLSCCFWMILLYFELLHKRQKLTHEARKAQSKVQHLMNYERAEGSNLKFCEVIRHIHPGTSKWIAKRIIWHIVQSIFNGFYRRQSTSHYQRIIDRHPRRSSTSSEIQQKQLRKAIKPAV